MRVLDKQLFEVEQQTILTTKKWQRRIQDEADLVQRIQDQKAETLQMIEDVKAAKE